MAGGAADYDQLAELYDETRGGERRGDEYAGDVHARLVTTDDPVLEIGVGTGVVALGLVRRGRRVVGVDIAARMLRRAYDRLGPAVIRGDAMTLPIPDARVTNAYSVWVLQAVPDASRVVAEAARILRPGGRYVVCLTQKAAPGDTIGHILEDMGSRLRALSSGANRAEPSAEQVIEWAETSGFVGRHERQIREWNRSPAEVLDGIGRRMWVGLRDLDDETVEKVTRPAIKALEALPESDLLRRGVGEILTLERI